MNNSLAANRRLASRVILAQIAISLLAGVLFLIRDVPSGIGAAGGGLVAAAGTCMLALRVFARAPAGPGAMVARFAVGTVLKWIVVIVGLYLVLVYWRLPAMPVLVGLIATLVVNFLALKFER